MSSAAHVGVALAAFAILAPVIGPAGGAAFGIGAYWMREGTEAQYATRRPKSETWWLPFAPWAWQPQMRRNAAYPAVAVCLAWAGWEAVF